MVFHTQSRLCFNVFRSQILNRSSQNAQSLKLVQKSQFFNGNRLQQGIIGNSSQVRCFCDKKDNENNFSSDNEELNKFLNRDDGVSGDEVNEILTDEYLMNSDQFKDMREDMRDYILDSPPPLDPHVDMYLNKLMHPDNPDKDSYTPDGVAKFSRTIPQSKSQPPREINKLPISSRVLGVGSVRKMTKGGRINRFRATVVAGNMNGAAGFGFGKGYTVREAIQRAYLVSLKNWVTVDRTEDHGIYHDTLGKFNNTLVMLRANRPYKGIVAQREVRAVLECIGIETATSKVHNRRTTSSIVFATFNALGKLTTPYEMSEKLGKKLVRKRWY